MYETPGGPYRGSYNPYFNPQVYEERREIRKTANAVSWTALIGVLLMTFALPLAMESYLSFLGFSLRNGDFLGLPPALYYLLIAVDYVIGLAVPVLLFYAFRHIPLSDGLPFRYARAGDVALYTAAGCMICMLANYPANWVASVQEYFGFSGELPSMPLTKDPLVIGLYVINVVVIPPLVEEMMFRGLILQNLRRFGDGFAVLFSAMLFGLYHGNFIQMAFAFVCGLALGFAAVRTNSLLPCILIHFINNSVSMAEELAQRFGTEDLVTGIDNTASAVLIGAGLVALLVLGMSRRLFSGERKDSGVSLSSRMAAAFGNPGAVAFVLYGVISSVYMLYNG